MLPMPVAQVPVAAKPEVVRPYEVRSLPGQLDNFRVFNSNSPELVTEEGILLSTFPPTSKKSPGAHLNFPLEGRFDIFAHHVSRSRITERQGPLYMAIVLHNPTSRPIRLLTLQATSYLNDQAPFIDLPAHADNRSGRVYSGPGSRAMSDVLRRQRQSGWDVGVTLEPGQSHLLVNLPIAEQSGTARSTWMRLYSNGKLYAASLAKFARPDGRGGFQAPQLSDWLALLANGDLAQPRDRAPTPLNANQGEFIYGRVAGISQGSEWQAKITDADDSSHLNIPQPGEGIAYVINSLDRGTLGTGQVQSAEMLARYPDTAYRAHGNYAVKYDLEVPLHNPHAHPRQVTLALQTPIKEDRLSQGGLRFLTTTDGPIFFRGTVRVRYTDAQGQEQQRYVHLVQRRGQMAEPLLTLTLPPQQTQPVRVELLYPPDATPPQVLTIRTLDDSLKSER
ncbi:DUF3370 family protein [Synechococcales cyanobacterium C]|uniref:DUF3370 family protein n=2 Tax=Petrachloros TaxID=2918834 RepID=A0A8K2A1X3_9CYAN|nr:DUF3370 family protein [Petrachloros mirabilis ULC683]